MKTWNDYKEYVKKNDHSMGHDLAEAEEQAKIISAVIEQRHALGLSQRDLAQLCGKPGYYTCRIDGDDLEQLLMDYDFWLKPEGNDLREIPLNLF